MGSERNGVAVRVHFAVVEIIVALRIVGEGWIVFVGREYEWGAATPATHQFCRDPFLLLRRLAVLAQELAECAHMFLQPAISHIGPVSGQNFGLWQSNRRSILVGIAENKFAGF